MKERSTHAYLCKALHKIIHELSNLKIRIGGHFNGVYVGFKEAASWKHKLSQIVIEQSLDRKAPEYFHVVDNHCLKQGSNIQQWWRFSGRQRPDGHLG